MFGNIKTSVTTTRVNLVRSVSSCNVREFECTIRQVNFKFPLSIKKLHFVITFQCKK